MCAVDDAMNSKIIALICIFIVAILAIIAVVVYNQPSTRFTGTRESTMLTADLGNATGIIKLNPDANDTMTYYKVTYHIKYEGTALTNVYFFFSDKQMFEPIIESGWTLNYETYIYQPCIGDSSSVKIVWTGGEQTLLVADTK